MKKKFFIFYLRSYNDTDHISPIIYKFLKEEEYVKVIYTSNYDFENDYRIKFFQKFKKFYIQREYLNRKFLNFLFKILLINRSRKLFPVKWNKILSLYSSPELNDAKLVIYDWGGIRRNSVEDTKSLNIPKIAIPHGLNIFTNYDVNSHILKIKSKTGKWPDHSNQNKYFDYYVFQSHRHLKQSFEFGHDPKKTYAWGSARFDPYWSKINLNLLKPLKSYKKEKSQTVITFFLPHWSYNVNYTLTINCIKKIILDKSLLVIIKNHSRGTGSIGSKDLKDISMSENVILNSNEHSASLIYASDIVINFGSSIGIEGILQNKVILNPIFLHKNKTIFDKSKLVYNARNEDEIITLIQKAKNKKLKILKKEFKDQFMKNEIFAGEKNNVLDTYYNNIKNILN